MNVAKTAHFLFGLGVRLIEPKSKIPRNLNFSLAVDHQIPGPQELQARAW